VGKKRAAKARKSANARNTRDSAYRAALASRRALEEQSPKVESAEKNSARSILDKPVQHLRRSTSSRLQRTGPVAVAVKAAAKPTLKVGGPAGGRWEVSKRIWLDVYLTYLASPQWMARQRAYLSAHGASCNGCGCLKPVAVKHLSYIRLTREEDGDLTALCARCQGRISPRNRPDGAKVYLVSTDVLDHFGVPRSARRRHTPS
jgi:hypothetical protein